MANDIQLLGSRADSEGGFGGAGLGAAGAGAAARGGGRPDQEGSGSMEDVPWDDGEPPF
jgi:hypothetical protein